jgi:hypothetical protein
MVVRWTFDDPVATETYTFHVNPNEGGSPSYEKTINDERTTAPDGKALLFEGQDKVQRLEWSGVILEQAHYDKYVEWWQKRRQIKVTDDFGREFWIYLIAFTPTRRIRGQRTYPWRHDFRATAIILDWETGP